MQEMGELATLLADKGFESVMDDPIEDGLCPGGGSAILP